MLLFRKYVVSGSWIDKATGIPKTRLIEVREGKNRQSGNEYQMVDDKSSLVIDGRHDIGNVLTFEMRLSTDKSVKPAQEQSGLKLNTSTT